MAVMWQTSGKWGAIIKDVFRLPLGASQLLFEGVNVVPKSLDAFLLSGKGIILAFWDVLHYAQPHKLGGYATNLVEAAQ